MEFNVYLTLNNILLVVSSVLILGVALFTYLNGRKKEANIVFSILLLSAVVFMISHAVGVNLSDPELSRRALMWNLVMFASGALQVHAVLALLGKSREKRWFIIFMYVSATLFVILFSFMPDLFLLPSQPKMYFTNYYVPGVLNWIRIAFLYAIALMYSMYVLIQAMIATTSAQEYKQYMYLFWSYMFGYVVIFIPNFLVYDIQINPIWGTLWAPIFVVPFLYGAIRHGMLNISVVAKQAFLYGIAVAVIGGFITVFNYSNIWIKELLPGFPLWISALISSVLAVTIGIFVWKQLRENDLLKYEFISTVTHKFRTPLTHIKWASETLGKEQLSQEGKEQVKYITEANMKLVELTNILAKASEADTESYDYRSVRINLSEITDRAITSMLPSCAASLVSIKKLIEPNVFVRGDDARLTFVLQTMLGNAVHYSPKGGVITVLVSREKNEVICSVEDMGIGISKEELSLLFSKFYRSEDAKSTDTEGMGIGLYISKQIVNRHGGKIWAESPGKGQGSTFNFSLPAV